MPDFRRTQLINLPGLLLTALLAACSSHSTPAQAPEARMSSADKLEFSFPTTDGELLSSEELLGRVTVLLFVTTFDVASQAQARRLEDLHRTHAPRINALGIVVEAPKYADFAQEFGSGLGLSYSLAMGERSVLDAHPQLRMVKTVPAWIVLSRDGAVVSSAAGALSLERLTKMVREAEAQ